MKIKHLRNATMIVELGGEHLLVDPMLAKPGVMPGFKLFGGGRKRNPLVPLPPDTQAALSKVTGIVVTHEHPDHFDRDAVAWIRKQGLVVWANERDEASLRRKGIDVRRLEDGALGMRIEVIPSRHGRGLLGWLMGPVAGYFFAHPNEPSLYLTGDSILTPQVLDALTRLQPEVVVAPAGAANVGIGGDILFSLTELVRLIRHGQGRFVLNHLESLDHCPVTRAAVTQRMRDEGLSDRVWVPEDGEEATFTSGKEHPLVNLQTVDLRPGFQKWLTAKMA
ncbi:MAG: MBL fold metallo-hydrolase [Nannocystaceae bacterium]